MRSFAMIFLLVVSCTGDDDDTDVVPDSGMDVDAGMPDTGEPEPCESWLVEYELTEGTQFDIRNTPFGRGDATHDVGPGFVTLRYPLDASGGVGTGTVTLFEYQLALEFEVSGVVTDVDHSAGPAACGAVSGSYDGDSIQWSGPVQDYTSEGTVTCTGAELVCGFAGLPKDMPVRRDAVREQDFMPFVFSATTATVPPDGFLMGYVEIPNDDAGDTFLRFTGVESERRCVRAPSCP